MAEIGSKLDLNMQFTRISTRQISTQDNLTNTKMPTILAMAKVSLSSVTQKPKNCELH